jgi:hypothetical protein
VDCCLLGGGLGCQTRYIGAVERNSECCGSLQKIPQLVVLVMFLGREDDKEAMRVPGEVR